MWTFVFRQGAVHKLCQQPKGGGGFGNAENGCQKGVGGVWTMVKICKKLFKKGQKFDLNQLHLKY